MGAGREADTSYDRYARMVRRALGTPVSLVSFVETERQVFRGAVGLAAPWSESRETPLTHSFCQHVVRDERPLVVTDARHDDRVRDNLAIRDLDVVAYAGYPITDHTGTVIGSLCAIDSEPRAWSDDDLDALADLAAACSSEIAQRALREEATRSAREAEALSHRSTVLLSLSQALSATRTLVEVAAAVHEIGVKHLGCLRAGIWLTDADDPVRSADLPAVNRPAVAELRYVDPELADWESASRNAALRADTSNPLGDALVNRRSLAWSTVAAANARYPDLDYSAQLGAARAFEPLVDGGQAIGAMAFVWDGERTWSDDDRTTLAALATYTAQAVRRALLVQDRLDALVTLQSALLPALPEPDDLALAARYRPASERDRVGGDWYDAVVLPGGATSLVVGDVVGHDMAAAAVMGQLRTMVRAIAWAVDDSPAAILERLDQATQDLRVDGLASLVHARIEQTAEQRARGVRTLRWANAGHPPPLLVDAQGRARYLDDAAPDLMLGIVSGARRTDNRVEVPIGSTVLLYTDGLVERRGEHLDEGLERLRRATERHSGLATPALLDRLLDDLLGARLDDDVALLAVRFDAQP